jgi:hypothetical protein
MSSRSLVLTFSFLALQLSLAPAGVTSAEAQGQAQAVSKYRFQALDKNRDGRITREEWDGNDRSFQNDGVLSGNEVRPGAHRDTELADHQPNRFERNLNWTRANFTSLDHNRDGRLSANEWHFDIETFRRVDANRNDSISLQEFPAKASTICATRSSTTWIGTTTAASSGRNGTAAPPSSPASTPTATAS